MSTLSLSGLSSPYSFMSNLATTGLNQSCKYIPWSHEAIISGPHAPCICLILSMTLQFIVLWCNVPSWGSSIFIYSVSELSSSSSSALISGLNPLVCSLHPVCYSFATCGICVSLLLRDTGVYLRLFCVSLLWPWCWASPHWPSHLGWGQIMIVNK